VEINFDIESSSGESTNYWENTDFRVQVRKRFLNDRLLISVDGVASGRTNDTSTKSTDEMQAYFDNITAEYSLRPDGLLKIKLYNERDRQDFFAGEVIKLGGALVFSKDFKKIYSDQ